MALAWQDKKQVTMFTTCHIAVATADTGKKDRRNNLCIETTGCAGLQLWNGVMDQDQQLASFPLMRRYANWRKKIFFCVMDIAIYNSYALAAKIGSKKLTTTACKEPG